jgi:hypothetical protein
MGKFVAPSSEIASFRSARISSVEIQPKDFDVPQSDPYDSSDISASYPTGEKENIRRAFSFPGVSS